MQGMSLEDIMLCDMSHRPGTSMARFHSQEVPGAVSFRQTGSRMVVVRGCREGKTGGWCLMGTQFQFGKTKSF